MHAPVLAGCMTALVVSAVGLATCTDLRRRRIPNRLTLPAIVAGLVVRIGFQGWEGLAVSTCGLVGAPALLVALHAGRGPGMGDVKLMAAVGSILGLPLALVAVLLTAIAGGLLALGAQWGGVIAAAVLGGRGHARAAAEEKTSQPASIPYAVGIGIGALSALTLYWWTENERWLRWGIAGTLRHS